MWDHHAQMRFTLVWAADNVCNAARQIVVRSLFATWRPPPPHPPRSEPEHGFQLHSVSLNGVTFVKVLWKDPRECNLRFFRYSLFEQYKKAVVEQLINPAGNFGFQMDNTMQGLSYQHVTGKDIGFELAFRGDLDELGVWIQQYD